MAPAATPGRKKRENQRAQQYFEPGVVGRKTGITLPQNARDEHGIEDLDGIFSSPEKAPPKKVMVNGNTTLTSSEMHLAQSSAPEPTEVLSTRRTLKSTKTVFPPALGRSPYKTNIGSSPRRQSSAAPRRIHSLTPEPLAPRPSVTRRLDFSVNGDIQELGKSALRKGAKRKSGHPPKKDLYALEATEDEAEAAAPEEPDYELPPADDSLQLVQEDDYMEPEPIDDFSEIPQISSPSRTRNSRAAQSVESTQVESEEETPQVVPQKQQRGKAPARRSLTNTQNTAKAAQKAPAAKRGAKAQGKLFVNKQTEPIEESMLSEEPSQVEPSYEEVATQPVSRAKGKQKATQQRSQPVVEEDVVDTTELDDSIVQSDISIVEPNKRKRGRPGKTQMAVHQDDSVLEDLQVEEATEAARPAKKARVAPKKAAKNSKAPKERDPNIMLPPAFKKPALPVVPSDGARWDESKWASSRNMSRLRDPTPSAEAMVGRTRSGRQIIRPLNHFANEKAQYSRDGTLVAVQTAENVEAQPPRRRAASRAPSHAPSRARGSRRMDAIDEEEDEAEELEDWEANNETIFGDYNEWDPMLGTGGSKIVETEIAWGMNSVPLGPVNNASFGFAKLLTQPFFGTGIIDMPADGFKRMKNSRKMSMHFFVHIGKVFVTVATTQFIVSAGGSWHVPRGNMYEIRNQGLKGSRIFFAQACEIVVEG